MTQKYVIKIIIQKEVYRSGMTTTTQVDGFRLREQTDEATARGEFGAMIPAALSAITPDGRPTLNEVLGQIAAVRDSYRRLNLRAINDPETTSITHGAILVLDELLRFINNQEQPK